MFFLILFGFSHVFLTGRTTAKKQHIASTVQVAKLYWMFSLTTKKDLNHIPMR